MQDEYKRRLKIVYHSVKKNELTKHKKTQGKSPQAQITEAMRTPLRD